MAERFYDNLGGFSDLKLVSGNLYGRQSGGDWFLIPTQGDPGTNGTDGTSAYVYVAYASDADGTGFSLTPSDTLKYRAEIHTTAPIVSPSLSDFANANWIKYIGDDGTNGTSGTNGTDGTSVYVYVAYASDADGTGFSLTPSDTLKYRAEIHTTAPIVSPSLSDFANANWIKYIGDDGTGSTVPDASTTEKGIVKIGSNINVSSGTISVKTATASNYGVVMLGTNTVQKNTFGQLYVPMCTCATTTNTEGLAGVVIPWGVDFSIDTYGRLHARSATTGSGGYVLAATDNELETGENDPIKSTNIYRAITPAQWKMWFDSRALSNHSHSFSDLTNKPVAYVIETWTAADGLSWYRLYSDNWIEQGGSVASSSGLQTITLPHSMSSGDYTALKNYNSSDSGTAVSRVLGIYNKTATTFQTYGGAFSFDWYVCGKSST